MQKKINRTNVNYNIFGNGAYVFVLHGWGCNCDIYKSIANILSSKYTVVIPDLPGFGKSDDPDFGWKTEDYTSFMIKFISSFGCKRVSLIGHSFGTRLMILMGASNELPFEIDKMVFIDGAGILSSKVDVYLEHFYNFLSEKKILLRKNDLDGIKKLQDYYYYYYLDTGDFVYLNDTMCECFKNAVTTNLENVLPNIKVPVLLIWGDNDEDTPLDDAKIMEKLIPNSGLVILNGAGHYSFLDQPYVFMLTLKSFFDIL